MLKTLSTASEVIDAVGGTFRAAAILNFKPQRVSNWRSRNRLPPETFLVLGDELRRRGFEASSDLWGIPTEARAS